MRFAESHEWIQLKGNVGTVGESLIMRRKSLGRSFTSSSPKVAQKVKAGQETCVLESTKAAADVYTPVSGKIIAVNEALRAAPSTINQTAESPVWLFQLEVLQPKGARLPHD